jgi:hypothetical protein
VDEFMVMDKVDPDVAPLVDRVIDPPVGFCTFPVTSRVIFVDEPVPVRVYEPLDKLLKLWVHPEVQSNGPSVPPLGPFTVRESEPLGVIVIWAFVNEHGRLKPLE